MWVIPFWGVFGAPPILVVYFSEVWELGGAFDPWPCYGCRPGLFVLYLQKSRETTCQALILTKLPESFVESI